jgi:hypothetical protein
MQPVDLHRSLLAALPRRSEPLTIDDLVCLVSDVHADADDVARWLAWARREGYLTDAGIYRDRRCYRVRSLGERRRRGSSLLRRRLAAAA